MSSEEIYTAADTADEFWKIFQLNISTIRENLSKVVSADDSITAIKTDFTRITEFFANSKLSLPPYDIRRSQEILDILNKEIKDTDAKFRPVKKFAFTKRAANDTIKATNTAASTGSKVVPHKSEVDLLPPGSYLICNKCNETVTVANAPVLEEHAGSHGVQVFIKNNQNCTIVLPWMSGSVRMEDLDNCQIILGPCLTSVYLENVSSCKLWISCHQLRIHNTRQSELYVKVNSHPIVEDCSALGFAPYDVHYPDIAKDFETAKLEAAHCWDNVVDFRWHKQTHSPNWRILAEDQRSPPPLSPSSQ